MQEGEDLGSCLSQQQVCLHERDGRKGGGLRRMMVGFGDDSGVEG